ncbi:hypothetical protein D7U98_11305 [Stenotrophomonas maltophilia]|nr:hypothetical protein [Stenotrophomonas maltophilia]MBA0421646.1 hypothetical protein [Stenotrophomonas maltophilia]RRU86583.1 hypothetical protein EGJ24_07550 [Stenotrophomonas maltophilia]
MAMVEVYRQVVPAAGRQPMIAGWLHESAGQRSALPLGGYIQPGTTNTSQASSGPSATTRPL